MCPEFGGQGRNGLASLALRAHYVRLSPLRGSNEPSTRGFSEQQLIVSGLVFQLIAWAPIAQSASPRMTMHDSFT